MYNPVIYILFYLLIHLFICSFACLEALLTLHGRKREKPLQPAPLPGRTSFPVMQPLRQPPLTLRVKIIWSADLTWQQNSVATAQWTAREEGGRGTKQWHCYGWQRSGTCRDFYRDKRRGFPSRFKPKRGAKDCGDIRVFDIGWLLFSLMCCRSTAERLEASCLCRTAFGSLLNAHLIRKGN